MRSREEIIADGNSATGYTSMPILEALLDIRELLEKLKVNVQQESQRFVN